MCSTGVRAWATNYDDGQGSQGSRVSATTVAGLDTLHRSARTVVRAMRMAGVRVEAKQVRDREEMGSCYTLWAVRTLRKMLPQR